jgi:hypothetical protein
MLRLSDIARRAFPWRGRQERPPQFASVRARPVVRRTNDVSRLVSVVRETLHIDERELDDADIALCLRAIGARPDGQGRWLAAFNSRAGQLIASRGADASADLHTLIALAAKGKE